MKVASLFCGAGGFDLGLKAAGLDIVWANDLYDDAADTYELNLHGKVDRRSITEIHSSEIPDVDVIVGGFPCQGFSVANWRRSMEDSRNYLYTEMVRTIKEKKPKFFVAENVKGLISMEKGAVIGAILDDFSSLGYKVDFSVLNAADYGVPQTRQRVFIIGIRSDLEISIDFPPTPTHARKPTLASGCSLKSWFTVGEALEGMPEPGTTNQLLNHTGSRYKLRFNGHLGHRRIDPEKPAPTVTARGDDKGGVVVLHHPSNQRRMTVRELATVQSFPLDYEFCGSNSSAYRQIGNAVPPLLGQAIGEVLISASKRNCSKPSYGRPKQIEAPF